MPNNRMSSLPMAQFCAHAPRLSSIGSGRAAAQSSAFHALCANPDDPKARELHARLTNAEQEEMLTWRRPTTLHLGDGVTLDYESADKELEVGINADGEYCAPDSSQCISVGHLDFAWVREVNGAKVAYIADLKRTSFAISDGVESLQLYAYLLAYASLHGCEYGVVGYWDLTEARWTFGELIDLGPFSEQAETIKRRVVAAAMHTPETANGYGMGPHCTGCYGRMHCPAYLIPPEHAETSLAPFVEGGAWAALTDEQRGEMALKLKRAEDTLEAVKATMKAGVKAGLKCVAGGKQWAEKQMPGRKSIDTKALEADGLAVKYTKVGAPYTQMGWVKL